MEKIIYFLSNTRGIYGNKYSSEIYHGGLNLIDLRKAFKSRGYSLVNVDVSGRFDIHKISKGAYIIYTTEEDEGLHAKSYLQDLLLFYNDTNTLIPSFDFFVAHHNKVYMTLLAHKLELETGLEQSVFPSIHRVKEGFDKNMGKLVIKKSHGASSTGVFLVENIRDVLRISSHFRTNNWFFSFKEIFRRLKYRGYVPRSAYRQKLITQEFVDGLSGDFKVLVFGRFFFVFSRPNRKNDFRASGSGKKRYKFGREANIPIELLDFARIQYKKFNVPHLSLDLANDLNGKSVIIEFQATGFGTSGVCMSREYAVYEDDTWHWYKKDFNLEWLYAESLLCYIENEK